MKHSASTSKRKKPSAEGKKPGPDSPRSPGSRRFRSAIKVVVCLLVIALVGTFLIYPQGRAWYFSRKAQQAMEAQDYQQARLYANRCLETWTDSSQMHFLLARCDRIDGDFLAASRHLDEAGRLGWPIEAIDLERLLIRAQTGDVQAVTAPLQRALDKGHPDSPLILEALVLGSLEADRLDDALLIATLLRKRFPDRWRSHLLLGKVLEMFLRPDLAATEYQRVVALKPNHADTHHWLGQHLLAAGEPAEAKTHYQAYQQARPDDPQAQLGIAACLYTLGQLPQARDALEQLPEDFHQNARARVFILRGQIALDLKGAQDALTWFQKAEKLAPQNPDVVNGLAACWRQLGDPDRAKPYEDRKQQLQEDQNQATELSQQIVKLDRDFKPADRDRRVQLHYQLGTVLLRMGARRKALAWFGRALQEDPQHKPTHQALADYYEQTGDHERAQAHRRMTQQQEDDKVTR
jgi:tetratricopeptide (TPR) repeat protein